MAKAKTKRQRKKLILFLVEGQSEKLALGRAIEKVCLDYYHDEVRVELLLMEDEKQRGGDFTSKYGVKPEKVEELIGKLYFTNFASKYGVYEKDIDPSYPIIYSITMKDHSPNTLFLRDKSRAVKFKVFMENYKLGNVRFETINIKNITYEVIQLCMYKF